MANCLAPGYVKISYFSHGEDHVLTLPVLPASVGLGFEVVRYNGSNVAVATAVAELLAILKAEYTSADEFTGWEQYTQADCSALPVFQGAGTLALAGTSGGTTAPYGQALLTFKTTNGGRGKFQWMEATQPPDQKVAIDITGSGNPDLLAAYLVGATSWIYARDNGKLVFPLNFVTKTNDKLRKKELHP